MGGKPRAGELPRDRLAEMFDIKRLTRVKKLAAGTINTNFEAWSGRDHVFVRINEGKTDDDVRYEARLVAALSQRGIVTPVPLKTRSGRWFVRDRGNQLSVFPWIEGEHRPPSVESAAAVGNFLAELHVVGEPLRSSFERASRYTPEAIFERLRAVAAAGHAALEPHLPELVTEMALLVAKDGARRAAPSSVIHGDLFPDNVLFTDAGVAALDFEQASTGSCIYDVAVAINAWSFEERGRLATPIEGAAAALLDGYDRRRPLSGGERDLLATELRAAAHRFAVTRITDVFLPGHDRDDKDFRAYLSRLRHWRSGAAESLAY